MSLRQDELLGVAAAIQASLPGASLRQIRAVDGLRDAVVLELRAQRQTTLLLLSASAGNTGTTFITEAPVQPPQPPPFVMLCRKHIRGARLQGVELLGEDRCLRLHFTTSPDPGAPSYHLVAELNGQHGNLLLLSRERILGALTTRSLGGRPLRSGTLYAPPVEQAWTSPPAEPVAAPAAMQAFQERLLETEARAPEDPLQETLGKVLQRQIRRLDNTLRKVAADAARADKAPAFRREAELLQTLYGQVGKGASGVEVQDWMDPEQPTVRITLDPSRSLEQNIAQRYHQARRLERGHTLAGERLQHLQAEWEALQSELESLPHLSAQELQQLAVRHGAGSAPVSRAQRVRQQRRSPFRELLSSDGWSILVGRGGADNDELTFQVARGNDLWLHAEDWAGAHVIVRVRRGEQVPPQTLHEAAQLAAHHCRGRNDTVVGVRWTERKHVRKPPGAAPGRVSVAGGRTISVRPDPELVQRLEDEAARRREGKL